MRRTWTYLISNIPWLLVLLAMDGVTVMWLWLADIRVLQALSAALVLITVIIFLSICYISAHMERRKEIALNAFFSDPNPDTEEELLMRYPQFKKELLKNLIETVYQQEYEIATAKRILSEYQDYVEMWAHEIKLPLSLLTLLLDNRKEDLPEEVVRKLDYIRNQIQDNISRILLYYRVRSEKKDYLFELLELQECLEDVLKDYEPLLKEKNITVKKTGIGGTVYTDDRGFQFMVGQIISNAIKYSPRDSVIEIAIETIENKSVLSFSDNGCGIKSCDLPYIFEKGFTGESGSIKKKATGMGLYLVKQIADDLKIEIEVKSEWMHGFKLTLCFDREEEIK